MSTFYRYTHLNKIYIHLKIKCLFNVELIFLCYRARAATVNDNAFPASAIFETVKMIYSIINNSLKCTAEVQEHVSRFDFGN